MAAGVQTLKREFFDEKLSKKVLKVLLVCAPGHLKIGSIKAHARLLKGWRRERSSQRA